VLTVMSGSDAGRIVALESAPLTIGRGSDVDLRIDDPVLSRQHARVARNADGGVTIEDLGSTNGTLVRGRFVTLVALEPGDYVQLGDSVLLRFALTDATEEALRRRLHDSSVHDPLTGVFNRRYLLDRLASEVSHARRHARPLALLMLDLDHFKSFNDTFGHLSGDRALCFVVAQIRRYVRAGDVLARYGGEEFVLLSRAADHEEAMRLAQRVRQGVQELPFSVAGTGVNVTVSVGVASLSDLPAGDGSAALLELADARLYVAKREGRNRVCGG
jgi:diguanylate cyclase (GGDEF)-like protein